jgi:hypothetical protein
MAGHKLVGRCSAAAETFYVVEGKTFIWVQPSYGLGCKLSIRMGRLARPRVNGIVPRLDVVTSQNDLLDPSRDVFYHAKNLVHFFI